MILNLGRTPGFAGRQPLKAIATKTREHGKTIRTVVPDVPPCFCETLNPAVSKQLPPPKLSKEVRNAQDLHSVAGPAALGDVTHDDLLLHRGMFRFEFAQPL